MQLTLLNGKAASSQIAFAFVGARSCQASKQASDRCIHKSPSSIDNEGRGENSSQAPYNFPLFHSLLLADRPVKLEGHFVGCVRSGRVSIQKTDPQLDGTLCIIKLRDAYIYTHIQAILISMTTECMYIYMHFGIYVGI